MIHPPDCSPPPSRFRGESPSDAELIAAVLFRRPHTSRALRDARQLLIATGSLRALMREPPDPSEPIDTQECLEGPGPHAIQWPEWRARLRAARELVLRSMHEELRERTTLGSPDLVRQFLCLWLRDRSREYFAGLFLDSQHRLISAELLFQGTISQTAVYPREIARRALALNASALIIAHNHPSGATEPSQADRVLTEGLKSTLRALDVPVLDHVIVAGNHSYSFAEAGLI